MSQIGSVVLFGLYLIVKFYGKEWITWLLQWYFTIAGVGSVGKVCMSSRAVVILSLSVFRPSLHFQDGYLEKHDGRRSITISS